MTDRDARYLASKPSIQQSEQDIQYARAFKDVSDAIDACGRSEKVALLLSTCRNPYLTLNALFAELRFVSGSGAVPSPVVSGVRDLRACSFRASLASFNTCRHYLDEYQEKIDVWNDRDSLYREFEEALSGLGGLAQDQVEYVLGHTKSELGGEPGIRRSGPSGSEASLISRRISSEFRPLSPRWMPSRAPASEWDCMRMR